MVVDSFPLFPKFESQTVEFKRILNSGEQAENWLKCVAAFANTSGGDLYVGIDNDGSVIGLPKNLVDEIVQLFLRNVKEHLDPLPLYEFHYEEVRENIYVIHIHIFKSKELPVVLKFHQIPSIYIREEGKNRAASQKEIVSLVLMTYTDKYDLTETNIPFRKEDFELLCSEYEKAHHHPLNEKTLQSIHFISPSGTLKKGSLLFSDAYSGADTAIKITYWYGNSPADTMFRSLLDIRKNIFESIHEAMSVLEENIPYREEKLPVGRKKIYDYPLRSVFEGLVNAFAHKNYFLKDSIIEINLFKNRMEITSPGGLVSSLSLNKERDIERISPTRRNELICNVLSLCNYMEKEGSGFDKIHEDYLLFDDFHQPFVTTKDTFFTLTLPNQSYEKGVLSESDQAPEITFIEETLFTDKQIKCLSYCYTSPRTIEEIAKYLGVSLSTYFRKKILAPLVEKDFLLRNNQFKASRYFTNHEKVKLK